MPQFTQYLDDLKSSAKVLWKLFYRYAVGAFLLLGLVFFFAGNTTSFNWLNDFIINRAMGRASTSFPIIVTIGWLFLIIANLNFFDLAGSVRRVGLRVERSLYAILGTLFGYAVCIDFAQGRANLLLVMVVVLIVCIMNSALMRFLALDNDFRDNRFMRAVGTICAAAMIVVLLVNLILR